MISTPNIAVPLAVPLEHAQVLALVDGQLTGPAPLVPFRGVRSDDRAATGDLFVAIRGARYDSHSVIPTLASRGVRGVVGELPPPPGLTLPYYKVASSRRALALLEQAFAGSPSARLRVYGVTGTNGKSTTVRLLAAILEAAERRTGWMSTVTQRLGCDERAQHITTPEPGELAAGMARLAAVGGTDLVLEVSSHGLVQERLAGISFEGALLTNLTRDHLDYHVTLESYLNAKLELFGLTREGAPVVSRSSIAIDARDPRLRGRRVLCFGLTSESDAFPEAVEPGFGSLGGSTGVLRVLGERIPYSSRLVGRHNIENILAAALLARALDIPAEAIVRGIEAAPPVRGRLESVASPCGRIYVDYAHTPDALEAVLSALREVTLGRLRVVFGCGGNRDRGKRPEMGRIAERWADVVYVTSDNPRREDPVEIVNEVLAGVEERGRVRVDVDRRAAIHRALRELEPGDSLVVAGKGHELEQEIGEQRLPFDDRRVIEEILAAWRPA